MALTKDQKGEVIEILKDKFSQYSNFYLADTESLSVEQISTLRRTCFEKNVELKVAKNTLIKRALEELNSDKYNVVFDSLHGVTALMFSDVPKDPGVIISSFRKDSNGERPVLKAALIGDDFYSGDENLKTLASIKSKNELIGEIIGLLQSPISKVLSALENRSETPAPAEASAE